MRLGFDGLNPVHWNPATPAAENEKWRATDVVALESPDIATAVAAGPAAGCSK